MPRRKMVETPSFEDHVVEELSIDESFLPDELKHQPQLYMKYASRAADLLKDVMLKEVELKEEEASHASKFRSDNAHIKITENMVKEYLQNHPDLIVLRKELAELKAEYEKAVAARYAFAERATMLELLVRMNTGG